MFDKWNTELCGTSPVVYVPDNRKSTEHALESGLGLGNILLIWIISYMEITHFHLLCNYLQNYILIKIPLPPPSPHKKIPTNTFLFPTVQLFTVAVYMVKPNTSDISIYS